VATSAVLLSSAVGLDRKLSGTCEAPSVGGRSPAQLIVPSANRPPLHTTTILRRPTPVHPETSGRPTPVWPCAKPGEPTQPLERLLVMPPGDDQPLVAPVGGSEQLESLEPLLVVNCAGAGGKALRQLVSGTVRHG